MKRITAIFLAAFSVLLLLSSCSDSAEEKTDPVERPIPEAKYNPEILDAGRIKNSLNTSDLWYPDGGDGHAYIYFTKTSENFLMTYVDHDTEKDFKCTVTEEKHLVSDKVENIQFDIAFYDAFTCYDYNTKTWYSRGDSKKIESAFAGKTLAEVNDNSNVYVFNSDGTCTETYKGGNIEGKWNITASTVIVLTFGDYSYTYDIDFDDLGNIIGISQRAGRTFDIVD